MAKRHNDPHPSGILSRWTEWFGDLRSTQVQAPQPLGPSEMYTPPLSHLPIPNGRPIYQRAMVDFDYGASAFAFDTGRLTSNPIGAGVTFTSPLPIEGPYPATVVNHTMIFWRAQMTNGGLEPEFGPLYAPDQLRQALDPLAFVAATPPQNLGLPNF